MKQTYNHTWQFYLRMMHLTNRRADFQPYFILKSVDDFIMSSSTDLLDWGCGENNLKLIYPHRRIIGIDKTIEADIYGYPDTVWNDIPHVDSIVAINSIHFNKDVYAAAERIMDQKMPNGGKMFLTINNTGHAPATEWADSKRWEMIGNLTYFWFAYDHQEELKNDLRDYLFNDQLLAGKQLSDTKMEDLYNNAVAQTILNDPWYGVLRIGLERT